MSELEKQPGQPPAGADPEKPATPAQPAPKKGRWKRRLKIAAIAVLLAVVVFRVALYLLLPTVIRKVAAHYGLECRYDRMQLSLTGGDVGIWRLNLAPRGGGEAILKTGYVRGNISVVELFKGRLEVWRAEVDGADVVIDRGPDGRIASLQKLIDALPLQRSAAGAGPTTAPATAKPIDLAPPLRLEALRLSRMRIRLVDRSVTPSLDATIEMNIRVSDVNSPTLPTRFEIDAWSNELLDGLHVVGDAQTKSNSLQATAQVVLSGLHPRPLAGYMAPFALKPASHSMSARLNAFVRADVHPDRRFGGIVRLRDISTTADGAETLGASAIAIDVDAADAARAVVPAVSIENPRASARLTPSLSIILAGLEIDTQAQRPESSSSMPRIEIGKLETTGGAVELIDGRISQEPRLRALIRRITSAGLVIDQKAPDEPMAIKGDFELPGLARTATLDLNVRPFAARKTVNLNAHLAGLRPDMAKPYLDMLGLRSELKDATFDCAATAALSTGDDGSLLVDARASRVVLADGQELLNLQDANIAGLRIDGKRNLLRVESIDVTGPTLLVRHEPTGAVSALGIYVPIPLQLPSAAPTTRPAAPAAPLPRIEVARLSWKGLRLTAEDRAVSPPATLSISDAGVELSNLCVDLNAKTDAAPGKINAYVNAPGLAQQFRVQGSIIPRPSAIGLDLDISGQGLSPVAVQSYLKPLKIEPLIRDGLLKLQLKADLGQSGDSLSGNMTVQNLRFADAGRELAKVDLLRVGPSKLSPKTIDLSSIEIAGASAGITREADGRFVVAGVRLPPMGPTTAPASAGALPEVALKQLRVRESSLEWTDLAVKPRVQTQAIASIDVDNLTIGKSAPPATLKLTARVKDVLETATVTGQIVTAPSEQSASLDIDAAGLRAGALAPYIPPQVDVRLRDGRVKTHLDARLSTLPKGGYAAQLDVRSLDYRDGEAQLVKLESLKLHADRLDPKDLVFSLDEFSTAGLETDVRRLKDGSLAAGGVRLPPQPPAPVAPAPIPAAATPAESLNPELIAAQARKALPLIAVKTLDVKVRRLTFTDEANTSLPPIALYDFRLNNQGRIEWMGKDANNNPPTRLQMSGRLEPVADRFNVNLTATPFANQPSVNTELVAGGIKGAGVQAFLPELRDRLDCSTLSRGEFKASLESQIKLDRRVANDFDLTRGFDLDLLVRDVEFRASPGGPVLAGLKELRTEKARIHAAAGVVHLRNLEITGPSMAAIREADGLHAMGVVVRLPELPTTRPAAAPSRTPTTQRTAPAPAPAPTAVAATPPAPTTRPAGEIRIDRLLVSGVDIRLEDRVLDPPLLLPLNSLDLEVRDLSTAAMYEAKPVRFNLIAAAGKVRVPKRVKSGGVAGAIGDIALLAGGKKVDTAPQFEDRELFAQVVASGNFQAYPRPAGWAKASVTGFELASVSGIAKYYGITLSNGTVDTASEIRIQPDGRGEARTRAVLNDLRISEPPNGLIARHLALPAPLDAAIAAVQDADGSITLPVKVQIKDGDVQGIPAAALGAVGHVMITALASAPAKSIQGVTALAGINFDKKVKPLPPVTLTFPPGHTGLEPDAAKALDTLVAQLQKEKKLEVTIKHDLGQAELARAQALSNPAPDEAGALAQQLRERKVQLLQERSAVAGEGRARLITLGPDVAGDSLTQLRAIDRELAQTEEALDRLYELTRPGAERQADRRTRAAAIEIGKSRLDLVRQRLLDSGIPNIQQRLRIINATFNPAEDDAPGRITLTTAASNAVKK